MAQLSTRKDYEKFVIEYYTKNKPKGIPLSEIRANISNSFLHELKDEVKIIKSLNKKSKVLRK